MINMDFHCYAQRILNPFRGAQHIISFQSAEAVTIDGINWDIYVKDAELLDGLPADATVQISEIRYGHWSKSEGLIRGSLNPSDNFKRLEAMGAKVYQYLLEHHHELPFPFADQYELWLLDKNQLPLALLNAVVDIREVVTNIPIVWRAGNLCNRRFKSDAIALGKQQSMGEYLTSWVNSQTKPTPSAQWFMRRPDQDAIGMRGINLPTTLEKRRLANDNFPKFFLHAREADEAHRQLLLDYYNWLSPWLLLLDTLNQNERQTRETMARRNAPSMVKQYHLYPTIIDQKQLNAALVEVKLRESVETSSPEEDHFATYYIELNDPHTN